MKIKILFLLFCITFPLTGSAQASGGQITRKKPNVSKPRRTRNNSSTNYVSSSSEQVKPFAPTQTSRKADTIHLLYTSSLSRYNVVTSSFYSEDEARNECQSLRDKGYLSNIYFDNQMQMYHILMFSSTNKEQIAIQNRNNAREIFPEAWILCIEKGRTYRYGSSGNGISSTSVQTKPVASSMRKGASSIGPIYMTGLSKYNIVAKTWSTLTNAQEECQSMRNNGFHSNVYFESSKTYRVLIYSGTNNEQEAILLRNKAREKYPAAWIMCVENGRTYKYDK